MVRGETTQNKVHYKGKEDDFIVFVDDSESFKKWQEDKSVPLAQVVSSFKIFVTHKHGVQGNMDEAGKGVLENEFDTTNEEEAIKLILEKGALQEAHMPARQGTKNDSKGAMAAH